MRRILATITIAALVILGALALLTPTASADVPIGATIYRIPTDEKVVAITFDDRLRPAYAYKILAALKEHGNGATVTFFTLGQSLEDYPTLAKRIVAAGCRIGDHTYGHVYLSGKGYSYTLYQIRQFEKAARYAQVPDPTPLFRSPGGSHGATLMRALKAEGYTNILWTISTGDTYKYMTANGAYWNIMSHLQPGAIILAHGSRPATVAALPRILDGLEARGYRVVDLYSYLYPDQVAPPETTTTTTLQTVLEELTTTTVTVPVTPETTTTDTLAP